VLFSQRVQTVTHVVELLDFVQNCMRVHEICGFPEKPRVVREKPRVVRASDGAHRSDKSNKGSRSLFKSGTLMNAVKMR